MPLILAYLGLEEISNEGIDCALYIEIIRKYFEPQFKSFNYSSWKGF
jgi:hypothetical protein